MKRAVTAMIALAAIAAGTATAVQAKGPDHCPPGLAKKTPKCIPPGLAKKDGHEDRYREYRRYDGDQYREYRRGDRIPEGYELVLMPKDYGLPRASDGSEYYVVDDVIFEVSKETREILDLYRAVDAVLN